MTKIWYAEEKFDITKPVHTQNFRHKPLDTNLLTQNDLKCIEVLQIMHVAVFLSVRKALLHLAWQKHAVLLEWQ